MIDVARLQQTLGTPDLAWLIDRLRQRLERGDDLRGSVNLDNPSPAQRAAVDRLLGRTPTDGASLSIDLERLEALLRHAELCESIREAVDILRGPVTDRHAQQILLEEQWSTLFAEAATRVGTQLPLQDWIHELRASGLLRRLSGGDLTVACQLILSALDVIARLPARGIPLAELAASVAGDSHALDRGRSLGTLVVRAAASLAGIEQWEGAEARRDIWASVGVLCDELSAPVLTLNLRADRGTLAGNAMQLHADAGEPYRISVRQLLRDRPLFDANITGQTVYVCENPTVLAASANRLGTRCAPLVCIEGQPRTAARVLLSRLAAAGITMAYHGDFDWAGIQIANLVIERHRALPWRFRAGDYLATSGGTRLRGTPVPACWDPELTPAMIRSGRAIHEEQVLNELLQDLAPPLEL